MGFLEHIQIKEMTRLIELREKIEKDAKKNKLSSNFNGES